VAWMSACCECCVLSGRGLCDELITRPEESYRPWCVVVCDLETSRMRRAWPALGRNTMTCVGSQHHDLRWVATPWKKKLHILVPVNTTIYHFTYFFFHLDDQLFRSLDQLQVTSCYATCTNVYTEPFQYSVKLVVYYLDTSKLQFTPM
jgi:hypothetical protein